VELAVRIGVADEARGLARADQRRAGPVEGYADLDRVGPTQDEQGIAQIDPAADQRIGATAYKTTWWSFPRWFRS
jgi:hypothetical protein